MAALQSSLILGCLLISAGTHYASGAAMECHSIVGAGLRCRWPDEGLECACIPNAECAIGSNACRCLPGYTGPNCERSCPYDDNGQCLSECIASPYCYPLSSCRQEEGACLCKEGYSGKDCNLCDHNVMLNCTLCPYQTCENGGKCDLVTWRCACEDGYKGDYCSLCYPSLHPNGCGDHCDLTCVNAYCDTHTGDCSCPYGFDTEADCSFCDPMRVSDHCQRFCRTVCRAGGLCNVEQERCMCKDGYVGDDCRLCDPRTHPEKCIEHCSSECQNNGYCDVATGYCLCQPGYEVTYNCGLCRPSLHSDACVNHCEPQCRNGGDCMSSQGLCMCPIGYIQHDCSVCIPGLQARNCTDHCPLCDNNATCDTLIGQCICMAGWYGSSCSDPCPAGTYGLGCKLPCDCGIHQCDPLSGACVIQTTTPKPTTTTIPPTTIPPTTTLVATTTAAKTTVASTTLTTQATTPATTPTSVTNSSTPGPVNVVELSSTKKQDSVTISAGAGIVPTQQSPEEIASLAPGLVLENRHQNFSSTYVIAIVISAIILIILLSLLIFYLIYDRRKRKRQLPDAMPEEIPLNNVVTNNLENGRSSNIYIDGILPILTGEQPVDGALPDAACCNRKSLTQEQVQRLSRISGDMAFFAKIPNAVAESKNPNFFKEASKDKFGLDDDEMKPNNNEPGCKASGCDQDNEDDVVKGKCSLEKELVEGVQDELLGACGGAEPGPTATSTPMKPADRNSRIYEEVILTQHDPTENRNPRMSGEYYLLEPTAAWRGSTSNSSENESAKAAQDDRTSQSSNPRRSADSGIEQAAASLASPHYEQLERPVDFVQPRSPTLSRSDKSEDERDSGVYAHLSRGTTAKGYNRLEFSPRRKRKPTDVEFFSENHYGRLKADGNEDDSMSD